MSYEMILTIRLSMVKSIDQSTHAIIDCKYIIIII